MNTRFATPRRSGIATALCLALAVNAARPALATTPTEAQTAVTTLTQSGSPAVTKALLASTLTVFVGALNTIYDLLAPKHNPTFTGTVTINPTANSIEKGINISQTGPTSGTSPGAVETNKIEMVWRSAVSGIGSPGATGCACITPFQTSLNVGGSNFDAVEAYGASFGVVHSVADTSHSDKVGASSGVYSSATSNGRIYGGSAGVTSTATSSTPEHIGYEIDSFLYNGATVPYRLGLSIGTFADGQASTFDTGIGFFASGTAGTKGFKTLIGLKFGTSTNSPVDSTGDIFKSESAFTIANVLNLNNATVTGNIILSPSVILSGSGSLTIGEIRATHAAATVSAGQIGYGSTTAAVANCGGAATACIVVNVAGTTRYIPYY